MYKLVGAVVLVIGGYASSFAIEHPFRTSAYPLENYLVVTSPILLSDRVADAKFFAPDTRILKEGTNDNQHAIKLVFDTESDKVLGGGILKKKGTIKNSGSEAITISSMEISGPNAAEFVLETKSFPVILAEGKELPIQISFKPTVTKAQATATATLQIILQSGAVEFPLSATAVPPMPTGATISIQDTQSVIGLASTEYTFARDYSFKNTSDKTIEILDGQMSSGENGIGFISFLGAELPVTLQPGQKISARLSYNAPTDGSMRADRFSIITADRSYSYAVQAMRTAPGNNGMANRQLPLTVVANPVDGTITVKLYAGFKGEVSIFNAAGALVANQKNTNAWIWKATSNGKPRTINEEYVVTVKAVDSDGSVLTRSERSVLTASK